MTTQAYLPEETMVRKAVDALMRELGPVETARFLSLARERKLDAVTWHRQWQAGLEPAEFMEQVFDAPDAQTEA